MYIYTFNYHIIKINLTKYLRTYNIINPLYNQPPPLFSIYILSIHDIIGQFPDVHYHIYADDIQLYSFLPNSSNVLPDNSQLCKCASTIRSWLLSKICTPEYPI